MPNEITAEGLQTKTGEELIAEFTAAFQEIYGIDIDLNQDSPDGQMMMIFIQAVLDLLDLITQVSNGFDPDNAIGEVLDQRVALNGIQRQGGTYTETNITLVTTQSLNLYGLDQDVEDVYTVQDNAGNQWYLKETETGLAAGTHALLFRAKEIGAVLTIPNTITIPVTVVIGVESINNPTTYSVLGVNQESDADLKVRRQRSTALSSQGYLAGLLAALENISGVTFAKVYENTSGSTDGDGIPGHSIWVIVAGTGADADIADAIYRKRNAGCGMKGDVTYTIIQADGSDFIVKWDEVESENLFIKVTLTPLDGVTPVNYDAILEDLPSIFTPGVYEQVNINDLATLIQSIDDNALITSPGFSTTAGGSYTNTLTPSAKDKQFAVASARVILLPIIVTPNDNVEVESGEDQQFESVGGYGAITWTVHVNNSGGSINSSTGLYTAGPTDGVTDTIRATDSLTNYTAVDVDVIA